MFNQIEKYEPKSVRKDSWEGVVRSLTFKSNFRVNYYFDINLNQERLSIDMWVPDSHPKPILPLRLGDLTFFEEGDDRLVQVGLCKILPEFLSVEEARLYIRECIKEAELHEMDEWIRFDGELVFDPHDPEKAQERSVV